MKEVPVYCSGPPPWGFAFMTGMGVAVALYVVLGVLYGKRRRPERKHPNVLAAHPHFKRWSKIAGLVLDGVALAKSNAQRKTYVPIAREDRGGSSSRSRSKQSGSDVFSERSEKSTSKDKKSSKSKSPFKAGQRVEYKSSKGWRSTVVVSDSGAVLSLEIKNNVDRTKVRALAE